MRPAEKAACFANATPVPPDTPETPCIVEYPLTRRASLKDVIEALGPPHTEIDALSVDNRPADFSALVEPGQTIHAHPVTPPMDPLAPAPLRAVPLPRMAFVVDVNIGRLARSLRMLGFDALYNREWDDARIAQIAHETRRIVLSRDRALLKRSTITHARIVRAQTPFEQLVETTRFFGLTPPYHPFSRCIACNGELAPVPKAEIMDRLLPLTKKYFDEFHRCQNCDKIYWQGSHHGHMRGLLARLTRAAGF